LYGSQGNRDSSEQLIAETLLHVRKPEDRAHALRLRGRNRFVQKDFEGAYSDIVQALQVLGVHILVKISAREIDEMFDDVKARLLRIGFDEMLHLPRASSSKTDLIVSLMSDGSTNAFWGADPRMADYMGLTVSDSLGPQMEIPLISPIGYQARSEVKLTHLLKFLLTQDCSEGISPGTAVGLFWCLGVVAEQRQMYRFCSDLGKLALQLAYKFGNAIDKW
jgi:hypothetical protein